MGNFYANVTVRSVTVDAVAPVVRALGRDAFLLQCDADVVVFDRETDRQDTGVLAALAEHLATRLDTVAFAVLDHDDDVLWFQLYVRSDLVAEYANRGGPATRIMALCETFASRRRYVPVWVALRRPYVFQVSRHRRLAALLNLPLASVACGFDYIERGEVPTTATPDRLVRIRRGS